MAFRTGAFAFALCGLTCGIIAPASAVIMIAPEFELSNSGSSYTLTNNSSDLYVWGLSVGQPYATGASVDKTDSVIGGWNAFAYNTSTPATAGVEYINQNNFMTLTTDIAPMGGSDSNFFYTLSVDPAPGQFTLNLVNGDGQQFIYDSGTNTVTAAVPEPSTWLMIILGFLGIGFMLRRRTSRTLSVA
jgi:hypothetical protein